MYLYMLEGAIDPLIPLITEIIGRGCRTEWPARSPALSPFDKFLWIYLKYKRYVTKPFSLEDFRQRIVTACRNITTAKG